MLPKMQRSCRTVLAVIIGAGACVFGCWCLLRVLAALLLCMDADLAAFTPAVFSHACGAADGVMEIMGGSWPARMRVG